jgi:hypothetical protein
MVLIAGSFTSMDWQLVRDGTPPMVSLGISQPSGNNGWYNAPVSVVVKAFDSESGVSSKLVSIGGKVWYENALVVKQDGTFRIYGRAIDKAGNVSTTSTLINVDMTKPELHITIPDPKGYQDWYVNPVPVRITGTDLLSGMSVTNLLVEGNSIVEEVSPWDSQEAFNDDSVHTYQQLITGTNEVDESEALIDESGIYRISGFVEDLAGNRTYVEKIVQVDMTPPQVAINSPRKFFGKITLDGSMLDHDSGIQKLFLDTGSGWQEIKGTEASLWQFEWLTDELKDGKYLIQAKVQDSAGNQSFAYYTATVLNHIWPIFTFIGVIFSLGLLGIYDPRRKAWREFSFTLAKMAHMEKNAMTLRKEMK